MRLCIMLTLALGLCTPAAKCGEDQARFLRMLGSDDFEEREEATKVLGKQAEVLWDQLRPLADSEDPEVRCRSRAALAQVGRTLVPKWLEKVQADLASHDLYHQEFKKRFKALDTVSLKEDLEAKIKVYEADLSIMEERCATEMEAFITSAEEEREAALKAVEDKWDASIQETKWKLKRARFDLNRIDSLDLDVFRNLYRSLRDEYEQARNARRPEFMVLKNRLAQLQHLEKSRMDLVLTECLPEVWDPCLVQLNRRLDLPMDMETQDEGFEHIILLLSRIGGLHIKVDETLKLRASNWSVGYHVLNCTLKDALNWLASLHSLEWCISSQYRIEFKYKGLQK